MARPRPPAHDLLVRVASTIRGLGGEPLPEPCRPDELPPEGDATVTAYTTGCGGAVRFELPYLGEDEKPARVTACVVDDAAHLWPVIARHVYG